MKKANKNCVKKCLKRFSTKEGTDEHAKLCVSSVDIQSKITYPDPGSKLYLKNYNKQLKHPFVIYADFEMLNVPVKLPEGSPKTMFTKSGNKVIHCPATYSDTNCAKCQLCSTQRSVVVAFPAHGVAKKKVNLIANYE